MDWSLFLFLIVILFFAYRGYRKGLLKSVARISSVLAGYVCAFLYTGQVSQLVESVSELQGIVAFLVASLTLFFGAGIVVGLLFWLFAKLLLGDGPVSAASAWGGAAVGSATGLLLAIVVVWGIAFVRDSSPAAAPASTNAENPSRVEKLANRIAGRAVASAMSLGSANPEIVKLTAAVAESPADMVLRVQRLAQSEDMAAILNDPRSQAALDSGDYEAVRRLPAFQRLVNNADMQVIANASGLLAGASAGNQALDAALAAQLTDIWGRAQRVKTDQRVQEIIGDAEFQQRIRSGNPLDLLTNDKLLELADIIFAEDAVAGQTGTGQSSGARQTQPESEKKLYRWVDDKGNIHFSDVEPDS